MHKKSISIHFDYAHSSVILRKSAIVLIEPYSYPYQESGTQR